MEVLFFLNYDQLFFLNFKNLIILLAKKCTMKKITFLLLFLSLPLFATTHFVDANATGNNSGTSWQNAFADLQNAINLANVGDVVFVKSGTYYPTQMILSGNNRSKTFFINKNIKIYGGFNGTETTLEERNIVANTTWLSGDFNGNDTDTNGNGINDFGQGENAYNVVFAYNLNNTALIDGFSIFGGIADGDSTYTFSGLSLSTSHGGGIYNINSNLVVKNTRFINNSASFGGGIANKGTCYPKIEDCDFNYNFASYGSGIYGNDASLITIINTDFFSNRGSGCLASLNNTVMKATGCKFTYNQGNSGPAIYNTTGCNTVLMNCIMSNNTASTSGGAMYNTSFSIITLYNTLVYNNHATNGGAVYNVSNSYINCINSTFYGNNASNKGGAFHCSVSPDNMYMKLYNTIIYGNTSPSNPNIFWEYYTKSNIHVRNSIIQGSGGSTNWAAYYGTNDGNNLDANPMFISTTQDAENLGLQTASPGIDASYNIILNLPNGNNSWTSADTDVLGNSRLTGNGVDIGAIETATLNINNPDAPQVIFFYKDAQLIFNYIPVSPNNEFALFDISGKLLFEGKINQTAVAIPSFESGLYILKIKNHEGIKFIID
ncbi:MAG: T9SS type A sorting domain-containing protein [Flavobacterium sp.]|nr:MAG: T9SS type A sorting domain-containing protein [Flavobacterium sp.]